MFFILEISFRSICGERWSNFNSKIVCQELGFDVNVPEFRLTTKIVKTASLDLFGLDYIQCSGDETNLVKKFFL